MSKPAEVKNGTQFLVGAFEILAGVFTKFAANNKLLKAYREHQDGSRQFTRRNNGLVASRVVCKSGERVTGPMLVHTVKDTIMRLGVRIGEGCRKIMGAKMRSLHCKHIECDEITVQQLHKCGAIHRQTVPVQEVFEGRTIWQGHVEVFDLNGHPNAKRAYAWSHREGQNDEAERFVTVLEIPPVTSPETAVKVAIAAEVRGKR